MPTNNDDDSFMEMSRQMALRALYEHWQNERAKKDALNELATRRREEVPLALRDTLPPVEPQGIVEDNVVNRFMNATIREPLEKTSKHVDALGRNIGNFVVDAYNHPVTTTAGVITLPMGSWAKPIAMGIGADMADEGYKQAGALAEHLIRNPSDVKHIVKQLPTSIKETGEDFLNWGKSFWPDIDEERFMPGPSPTTSHSGVEQ
jgi:GH24 family phage-related lysozyme (muramidase)